MPVSAVSSPPVMPSEATSSFALVVGERHERREVLLRDVVRVLSATSSMSMPPMSLKIITGSLASAS